MRTFILLVGIACLAFMILTFRHVPLIGCYMSSVFSQEIVLFGQKMRDPICIGVPVYFSGIGVSVALMVIGAVPFIRTALQIQPSDRVALAETKRQSEDERWKALVEYDPELGKAHSIASAYGKKYGDLLAKEYMKLNDKTYLPAIIKKIIEQKYKDEAEEKSSDFKLTEELETSTLFEVTGGHCLILGNSYRCFQLHDDGQIQAFDNISDRFENYPKDKIWNEIKNEEAKKQIVAKNLNGLKLYFNVMK